MFDEKILDKAGRVIDACREAGLLMVTAESCTGGLLTGALTAIPGSSDVLDRGYIPYSLHGKIEMLGVPAQMLAEHGAVSAAVGGEALAGTVEGDGWHRDRLLEWRRRCAVRSPGRQCEKRSLANTLKESG